jgi:hypothetical protein
MEKSNSIDNEQWTVDNENQKILIYDGFTVKNEQKNRVMKIIKKQLFTYETSPKKTYNQGNDYIGEFQPSLALKNKRNV